MLESFARLANMGKISESNKYTQDISDSYKRNSATIALGDQFIAGLVNTDDSVKVRTNMSSFLQNLKTLNNNKINLTAAEILLRQFQK